MIRKKLGENLTFYAQTHDPATGGEVDADAPPTYRIYEEETTTPILTGTMALLDDVNTVGYYSEQVACSVGNGFEEGKSYNVRMRAAVGGVYGDYVEQVEITAKNESDIVSDTEDVQGRIPAALTGAGNIKADALAIGGTTQTGRDIGTSVLLSSGTGTGQLDVTSGIVRAVDDSGNTLATSANQTTILSRLGVWTGSARNTILGAFRSLFRSDTDATIPSDINAVYTPGEPAGDVDNTTDSTEAIRDNTGTAGVGLSALGDTRIANLDATVSSRTKPADTQAAVTTVGTVTNPVTAGTVSDKSGYTISGTKTTLDALNDITAAAAGTDAASKVLETPANLLVTNASGEVQVSTVTGNVTGSVASVQGNVQGDVVGKLLGGGASEISGTGARVVVSGTKDTLDDLQDLSAQNIRDAMKLAPGVGSPAAGSVDTHLDTIEGYTDLIDDATDGLAAIKTQTNKIDLVATALPELATSGSLLDRLANKDGSKTYSQATDSLEALRDTAPMGAAMRGTDNAALASSVGTPGAGEGTLHTKLGAYSGASGDGNNVKDDLATGSPTAAQIADAVCDEALSAHTTAGTVGKTLTDVGEKGAGEGTVHAKLGAYDGGSGDNKNVKDDIANIAGSGGGSAYPSCIVVPQGSLAQVGYTTRWDIYTLSSNGMPTAPDATPTALLRKPDGTAHSTLTVTLVATGHYTAEYTWLTTDTAGEHQLRVSATLATNTYKTGGSVGLGNISPGTGFGAFARSIQLYVGPATTTAIVGATIYVRNSARTITMATGASDALGQFVCYVGAGTYYVTCAVNGYTFSEATMVVTAAGTTTIYGTAFSPAAPASAELCAVYGWIKDAKGTAISGAVVTANLESSTAYFHDTTNGEYVRPSAVTATSNALGYFEIQLYRSVELTPTGATYRIRITPIAGYAGYDEKKLTIPNAANVCLDDL